MIAVDGSKKGWKPVLVDFAVGVQIHDDLASRFSCASENSQSISIKSILF